MANVSHASLTGSELHEPKGADTAALGTVYVSNGAGSGTWSSVGTSSFTGMVADFVAPVAPTGWLELNGAVISTTTYSALYGVLAMQTSGTRSNGSAVITSVPDTSNIKAGYYVFGTGIASGTTVLSVDSATQITLSATASSSGTSGFAVSPCLLNTGTIKLPDVTTSGRYRRSRTSTTKPGDLLADQNKAHTHTASSSLESANHTHTFSGNTGTESATHTHTITGQNQLIVSGSGSGVGGGGAFGVAGSTQLGNSTESATHTHAYSGTTSIQSGGHSHTITVDSDGGTEVRPLTLVVMTCIKT